MWNELESNNVVFFFYSQVHLTLKNQVATIKDCPQKTAQNSRPILLFCMAIWSSSLIKRFLNRTRFTLLTQNFLSLLFHREQLTITKVMWTCCQLLRDEQINFRQNSLWLFSSISISILFCFSLFQNYFVYLIKMLLMKLNLKTKEFTIRFE